MCMFSFTRWLVFSRVAFSVSTLLLIACMHTLYSKTSRKDFERVSSKVSPATPWEQFVKQDNGSWHASAIEGDFEPVSSNIFLGTPWEPFVKQNNGSGHAPSIEVLGDFKPVPTEFSQATSWDPFVKQDNGSEHTPTIEVLKDAEEPELLISDDSYGVFDEYSDAQFNPEPIEPDRHCVKIFMQRYEEYCEASTVDVETNDPSASPLCACISRFLVGRYKKANVEKLRFSQLEARHPELSLGGHWSPEPECRARQRIALIVPFRDRTSHLKIFLRAIHPMLQNQLLEYTVFVVEQEGDGIFNKGYILNAAYIEIQRRYPGKFDCFIFHDVDMLPEDDRNFYTCADQLRHIGVYIDKYNYDLFYPRLFGGVTGFTKSQFELCNGFSLKYYGWGGEDDDLLLRIEAVGMTNLRFPRCVNAYKMIRHGLDPGNPLNPQRESAGIPKPAEAYQADGLKNLQYELIRTTKWPLYTHFLVAIPPPNYGEEA